MTALFLILAFTAGAVVAGVTWGGACWVLVLFIMGCEDNARAEVRHRASSEREDVVQQ